MCSRPVVHDGGSLAGNESAKVLSIISSETAFGLRSFCPSFGCFFRARACLFFDNLGLAIGSPNLIALLSLLIIMLCRPSRGSHGTCRFLTCFYHRFKGAQIRSDLVFSDKAK